MLNRSRILGTTVALALAGAAFALPTQARESVYVWGTAKSDAALHSGGTTDNDQLLADRIANALDNHPYMNGSVLTVTSNDGNVSVTGSVSDMKQAATIERIARDIAGPRATTFLDEEGGG
jgi:osmotically-inducible protein OsmY